MSEFVVHIWAWKKLELNLYIYWVEALASVKVYRQFLSSIKLHHKYLIEKHQGMSMTPSVDDGFSYF